MKVIFAGDFELLNKEISDPLIKQLKEKNCQRRLIK